MSVEPTDFTLGTTMPTLRTLAALGAAILSLSVNACGSTVDPFGPKVTVSLMINTPSVSSPTLHATVGRSSVSLRVPDGAASQAYLPVRGTGYGDVPVRLTLLGGTGDTLASVRFTQRLETGYTYGIGAIVGSQRFFSICGGTTVVAPLRNSTSDSLFVIATGLPDKAVC